MTPFAYLQNALILGAVFATYWSAESWWSVLWMLFWLSPSSPKCDCDDKDEDKLELPKIVVERE